LPLIGDSLKDGAQFIQHIREDLIPALESGQAQAVSLVQQALFNALGPPGLKLLVLNKDFHDAGGDGVPDAAPDFHDVPTVSTPDQIQFNLDLHSDLVSSSVPIDFDLGLPALSLDVMGDVKLMVG